MASISILVALLLYHICLIHARHYTPGDYIKYGEKEVDEFMPAGLAFSIKKTKSTSGSGFSMGVFWEECVFECAYNVTPADFQRDFNLETLSMPVISKDHYNPAIIRDLCSYSNTLKSCVDKCPDSNAKTGFTLAFKPTTYICTDEKFNAHLDGIHKGIVNSNCSNRENPCENQQDIVYSGFINAEFKNVTTTTTYFNNICQYYTCYTSCSKHQIIRDTTAEGFKVFKKSLQKKIVAAKETYRAMEEMYEEPNSCSDFRNDEEYE